MLKADERVFAELESSVANDGPSVMLGRLNLNVATIDGTNAERQPAHALELLHHVGALLPRRQPRDHFRGELGDNAHKAPQVLGHQHLSTRASKMERRMRSNFTKRTSGHPAFITRVPASSLCLRSLPHCW